jgi:hypothetical protein
MKGKQYSVKVYETTVGDEDKFISFFDTNYILFKDRLILIKGKLSPKIKEYLDSKSLLYANNIELPNSRSSREVELELAQQQIVDKKRQELLTAEFNKLSNRLNNNLKVQDDIVRSGQEIIIEGDLLLLGRVNSGAKVETSGNIIITQVVEGDILCYGNFMMIGNSPKANIIFHDIRIDNTLLIERLNKIEIVDGEILITPILKKEMNWA